MANNELFYRVAREALEDNSITGLIIDLDVAVESYLQAADEDGDMASPQLREEITIAIIHAERFIKNLRAWEVDQ